MAFMLAGALATANVTIKWNAHPASPAPVASLAPAIQTGRVAAVDGTRVTLQLRGGEIRNYTTTPAQARLLRKLIGATIQFRLR